MMSHFIDKLILKPLKGHGKLNTPDGMVHRPVLVVF